MLFAALLLEASPCLQIRRRLLDERHRGRQAKLRRARKEQKGGRREREREGAMSLRLLQH
jgi:hypothetical protein